jgi:hypothetical protein
VLATGVTLFGDGDNLDNGPATVFTFTNAGTGLDPDYSRIAIYDVDNVTLKQFRVVGGDVQVMVNSGTRGGFLFQDISVWKTTVEHWNAMGSWVQKGCTLNGMKFIRCHVCDSHGDGVSLIGNSGGNTKQYAGWTKNVRFEDCTVDYSAFHSPRNNDYNVGYLLAEGTNVQNLIVTGCEASYSWCSGFHFETYPYTINCVLQDCVSNYNGQKHGTDGYGWGYLSDSGNTITYINCTGTGNYDGLFETPP